MSGKLSSLIDFFFLLYLGLLYLGLKTNLSAQAKNMIDIQRLTPFQLIGRLIKY